MLNKKLVTQRFEKAVADNNLRDVMYYMTSDHMKQGNHAYFEDVYTFDFKVRFNGTLEQYQRPVKFIDYISVYDSVFMFDLLEKLPSGSAQRLMESHYNEVITYYHRHKKSLPNNLKVFCVNVINRQG